MLIAHAKNTFRPKDPVTYPAFRAVILNPELAGRAEEIIVAAEWLQIATNRKLQDGVKGCFIELKEMSEALTLDSQHEAAEIAVACAGYSQAHRRYDTSIWLAPPLGRIFEKLRIPTDMLAQHYETLARTQRFLAD